MAAVYLSTNGCLDSSWNWPWYRKWKRKRNIWVICSIIYCSSFGSFHRSHICFIGLAANTCVHCTQREILVSFGLAFWLGGKKTPFLLYHSGTLTESFDSAPASLTPNLCPALLQPCTGVPFLSHHGPTNLSHCFSLPSKPSMPCGVGNWLPVTILVLWKSKTNLPILEGAAALNLCHWCSSLRAQ